MSKKTIKTIDFARKIAQILTNLKGENLSMLDVSEISGVTDVYIIVSGMSSPHLKAMYDETQIAMKKEGILCHRKAGSQECGWMVLDYFDVVIHIFSQEAREYYAIEELWEEAPRLDPQIQ